MFDGTAPLARTSLFGPFSLSPSKRLLLENGKPVQIGSRALELLILLTERAGELVTKEELTTRLWPTTMVVGANLTVQISTLRRVLRDGRDGNRYIVNEPGRGYRFVAPVATADEPQLTAGSPTQPVWPDDLSVLRLVEACCTKETTLAACAANPTEGRDPHKALVDGILQRGIQALEMARTLLSIDPACAASGVVGSRLAH